MALCINARRRTLPRSARHPLALRRATPGRAAAIRWGAALFALALLSLPCWPGAAWAVEDHFAPEGLVFTQLELRSWSQSEAVSNQYRATGLADYLVTNNDARNHLDGSVTRDVQTTTLRTHLGLGGNWNLVLDLEQVTIAQQSSLRARDGNGNAESAAAAFGDDTISGLGTARLGLLKRSVLSDRHSYHWGFALTAPLEDPQNDYLGRSTLATAPPNQTLELMLHYTYFPVSIPRARLDLRPVLIGALSTSVTLPDGRSRTLLPGNGSDITVSWQQEFVPVTLGVELQHQNRLVNRLGGVQQGDSTQTEWARLSLGWGNLADLEQGPVSLPYRIDLAVERTVLTYNAPTGTALRLSLLAYF